MPDRSELNRLHFENVKTPHSETPSAADRHVDSWGQEGKEGRWTIIHRTARRSLFTPFKVAGGPGTKSPLKKIRITRGKYLNSGKTFKIIDDWSVRANAHRMLESAWLGTTDFRESTEFIDDDSDEEKERSATSPRLAERESPSGGTSAEPQAEPQKTEYFELSPAKSQNSAAQSELLTTGPKGSGREDLRQPAQTDERGRLDAHNNLSILAESCPSNSRREGQSSRGSVRQTPLCSCELSVRLIADALAGTEGDGQTARARARRQDLEKEKRGSSALLPLTKRLLAIDIIAVHGSGAWLIL
jgi:hypothetical protein